MRGGGARRRGKWDFRGGGEKGKGGGYGRGMEQGDWEGGKRLHNPLPPFKITNTVSETQVKRTDRG